MEWDQGHRGWIDDVQVYGGALLNPWFDRDLSLAGRVTYRRADGSITDTLVDFERPIAVIPSLAIHLDRGVNDERKINAQEHLPPLLSLATEEDMPALRDLLLAHLRDYRDPLWVYLAFGQEEYEAKFDQFAESYPDDATLRRVYRHLQNLATDGRVRTGQALETWDKKGFSAVTMHAALAIFEELGLVEQLDRGTVLELLPAESKRSLDESPTFCHAKEQRRSFERWGRWVLKAPAPEVARKL